MVFLKHKNIILAILFLILLLFGLFIFILSKNAKKDISVLPTPTLAITPTISSFPTPEFVPDQIIVKFKAGLAPEEIKDENRKKELSNNLKKIGVISEEKLFKNTEDLTLKNYYILKLKKGTDVLKTKKLLENLPEIESAEPNNIQKAL